MTCRECELILGLDEPGTQVDRHLASCPECRALALELRANAEALQALAVEAMPAFELAAQPAGRPAWSAGWGLAAAAMVVVMFAISREYREEKLISPVQVAVTPMKFETPLIQPVRHTARRVRATQPLMVKMLTPDPNVVIYWQIDADKEGTDK